MSGVADWPPPAPEGFTRREVPLASAGARERRSAVDVGGRVLHEAAERNGLEWGPLRSPSGSEPNALASRGALAIADKGSKKVYRLTRAGAEAIRRQDLVAEALRRRDEAWAAGKGPE